jgi:hypothetical protein
VGFGHFLIFGHFRKMETQGDPKTPKKFICEKCDYVTCHKNDFTKHCQTKKHQMDILETQGDPKIPFAAYTCELCFKIFYSFGGLCKHSKKCQKNKDNILEHLIEDNKELKEANKELQTTVRQLIERNDEKLTKLVIELCKNTQTNVQNNTLIQNSNCNNNNTTNNNSFNLNFFLNETCKDALNMSDFIKSIQVGFEDIERIGNIGYVDGISGIIIKSLQELGVEKRPIHCTDAKRQTLYIKENDEWTKEDSDWSHLQHMVNEVQRINLRQLPLWREYHPNCLTSSSKYTNTYNTMSQELMGGDCKKVKIQVKDNKIMNKIMKEVIIDKSLFLGDNK